MNISRPFARAAGPIAIWCLVASSSAAPAATTEYDVKAAYLYNFLSFVTWPSSAFETASAPIRMCIATPDPFGEVINDTMRDEQVNGHPIAVEHLTQTDGVQRCHVLFVSAAAPTSDDLMRAAGNAPVLAVGESEQFLAHGGVVRFVVDGGRVRFDISQTVAERRGLMLSSRLLRIARKVG